jgi:L-asparaginase
MGGTIQCQRQDDGSALPTLSVQEMLASGTVVPLNVQTRLQEICRLSSAAMGWRDLISLVHEAEKHVDAGAVGVVVTLGTDMLEECAFALDLMWARAEPLVVTAAMRSPEVPGSDGPANLRAAILVASNIRARTLGCVVVLNDEIHAAWQITKSMTANPAAFRSRLSGPIGTVIEDRVRVISTPMQRPHISAPLNSALPPVALVKVTLDDDGRVLDLLLGAGYVGAVIEVAGGGSVPPAWAVRLRSLTAQIPVVFASRVGEGPTLLGTYGGVGAERDLLDAGLLPAGMLDGLKARILLQLMLSQKFEMEQIGSVFKAFDEPIYSQ